MRIKHDNSGRWSNVKKRLARHGKIRLGEKRMSQSGKEYPVNIPTFRFEDNPDQPDQMAVGDELRRLYGDRPTELTVIIPSGDLGQVLPTFYGWYGGDLIKCIGDGETARRRVWDKEGEIKAGEWTDETCKGEDCKFYGKTQCNKRMSLFITLPLFARTGVFQIDSGSIENLEYIEGGIEDLKREAELLGVPVYHVLATLKRTPKKTDRGTRYPLVLTVASDDKRDAFFKDINQRRALFQRQYALPNPSLPRYADGLADAEYDDQSDQVVIDGEVVEPDWPVCFVNAKGVGRELFDFCHKVGISWTELQVKACELLGLDKQPIGKDSLTNAQWKELVCLLKGV